jgi:hypothetical protein
MKPAGTAGCGAEKFGPTSQLVKSKNAQVSGRFFKKKLRKKLLRVWGEAGETASVSRSKSFFGSFFSKKELLSLGFTSNSSCGPFRGRLQE